MRHYFVGIDGGATKTIVRVEDVHGALIDEETTGPGNIRISPDQAWDSIQEGLGRIFSGLPNHPRIHAVIGIAGCEVKNAYDAFLNQADALSDLMVLSDAQIACIGAHQGEDGAIIIVGSGSVGFQIENNINYQVGGWGFPHDDEGGGACLGLMAVKHTFQAIDGRSSKSALSEAILNHFNNDIDLLTTWANQANSTLFAQLAPYVIEHASKETPIAITLMQQASTKIMALANALQAKQQTEQPLPLALVGGISNSLQPYLPEELQYRLRKPFMTPAEGAAWLARKTWGERVGLDA